MENIKQFLETAPDWLLIGVPVLIVLLIVLLLWFIFARLAFKRRLKKVYNNPEPASSLIKRKYSSRSLQRKSRLIEKIAHKHGAEIISMIGVDDIWVTNLKNKKRKKDFKRVLNYAPQKGLFQCFLISMEKKNLAPLLVGWLEESKDFLHMRKLAMAGKGEPFSGQDAHEIFKEKIPEIREMTGDPEWPSRYFAVKVLIFDTDDRSIRAIWEAFTDPHPLVRKTVANEFNTEERERLYAELLKHYKDDPVIEIRQNAVERIRCDFADLHVLHPKKLTEEEKVHVLELLDPSSKDDENFALGYLDSPNLELRFTAANFLRQCGTLKRLCLDVDFGDQETLKRNFGLLEKASQVNVTAFLSTINETQNSASLLICANILCNIGDRAYIPLLAKKVFAQFDNSLVLKKVYQSTVECISKRGDEESFKLINQELMKWRDNKEIMELLLGALPQRGDFIFINRLLSFLKDPDFKAKQALLEALKRMPQPQVLQEIFAILKVGREVYPHAVRIEAIKLLGDMKLHYCLQTLLENLLILPVEEAREFTRILSQFPEDLFNDKVTKLLESTDARVRAALIACVSASGKKEFLKSIKKSLKDADPDVRIASVWSLVEYQDYRSLNQAVSLLRDPVERVREGVARAFGSYGSNETLNQLKDIIFDDNEVSSVKSAAIKGLAASSSLKGIDILIEKLEKGDELIDELIHSLARKGEKKEIAQIIENFKDASPALRERITSAFKEMKEAGENSMVELLKEDIPSLRPFIVEILDTTGHVEERIRKLSHRDPMIRRDTAEFLSLVATKPAFRGMVLAARDPDEEVRVRVIKALEKLETEEGNEILQALENDPERKVRKYTLWALERIKAKTL